MSRDILMSNRRITNMLASKACRSSIMVGDSLSNKNMENIVHTLANLQSPWNCPHGRPTMLKTLTTHALYTV